MHPWRCKGLPYHEGRVPLLQVVGKHFCSAVGVVPHRDRSVLLGQGCPAPSCTASTGPYQQSQGRVCSRGRVLPSRSTLEELMNGQKKVIPQCQVIWRPKKHWGECFNPFIGQESRLSYSTTAKFVQSVQPNGPAGAPLQTLPVVTTPFEREGKERGRS